MDEQLKFLQNIALSDADLFKLLDGKNKMVLYPDLHKYNNIDEVLGEHGMCTLLVESQPNYGHWVAVWKLNENTVSFFNSYGGLNAGWPDDVLKYVPKEFAEVNFENYPYLSELLLKSPYKMTYNEYKYQKMCPDVKTCGRHVAVRLFCRDLNDKQYYDYIKHYENMLGCDADEFVTLMTSDL
jgi:hypothetical protein